jgi:NADPH2:quinone reductase
MPGDEPTISNSSRKDALMKAVEVQAFGGPEVLRIIDTPTPVPGPEDVLIETESAGLNYADVMMRRGLYVGGPKPPFIPGFEAAGHVAAVGEKVQHITVGQRVVAMTGIGGYAQFACVGASRVMPLPDSVSFDEGAAFPAQYYTAYFCLHHCGKVGAGQTVLIHAAAGGVGTAAVQLAKIAGAEVFATASSDEKLALVKQLGADHVINYKKQDFAEIIKKETRGRGVDVILESIGGEIYEKSQQSLAVMGRLVLLGVASGQPGRTDPLDLLFRNKSIIGFHLGRYTVDVDAMKSANSHLLPLWHEGRLKPVVGRTFPLNQAAGAQNWISDRRSQGKVILRPKE